MIIGAHAPQFHGKRNKTAAEVTGQDCTGVGSRPRPTRKQLGGAGGAGSASVRRSWIGVTVRALARLCNTQCSIGAVRAPIRGPIRGPSDRYDARVLRTAQVAAQAADDVLRAFAPATLAASGTATPFFTAVTSARIDTAISGGVRLPM